jgi:hypothetical protein
MATVCPDIDDDAYCVEYCSQTPLPSNCTSQKVPYEVANDWFGFSYYLGVILGCSLLLMQGVDLCLALSPQAWFDKNGLFQRLVLPGTVRQERAGMEAASYFMSRLIRNAMVICNDKSTIKSSINSTSKSTSDKRETSALERFALLPVKEEIVGGVSWSWKKIWDGTIFTQEGIWLNGRMLTCNFSQLTVLGILIFLTRVFYYKRNEFFYTSEESELKNSYEIIKNTILQQQNETFNVQYSGFVNCTLEIYGYDYFYTIGGYEQPYNFLYYMNSTYDSAYKELTRTLKSCFESYPLVTTFINNTFIYYSYKPNIIKDQIANLDITPQKYQIAAMCGLVGGFVVVIYIAAIMIPSFVSTVMMFRSGVIPSLNDKEFLRYRYAMDTVTVLIGSAFWGCFFSAVGAMIFVFGVVRYFFNIHRYKRY